MEALQPERNASHNPLFQVLFNHQSEIRSVTPEVQLEDLRLEGLAWDGQTAQFDLTLDIQEDENGIWASFDYATDLFDASTVERLAGHWRNLLRGIVANPRQRLGELPLLDAPERRQTLWCLMSKQRRTFSAEFKREAAALVLDHGYSHIDACRSLGVVDSALRCWVKQLQQERDGVTPKSKALTPEQQKIQELEARINRLEREKAILKKATALLMSDELDRTR